MTQWTAEAWRKLSSEKMFAKKLFMKTGCLMTAGGSDDHTIKPQGLEPYRTMWHIQPRSHVLLFSCTRRAGICTCSEITA